MSETIDMVAHANPKLLPDQIELLKNCGYHGMFADRDSMEDAGKYLEMVAKGSGSAAHVITAAYVHSNTLLKILVQGGALIDTDLLGKFLTKKFVEHCDARLHDDRESMNAIDEDEASDFFTKTIAAYIGGER